ncbi:Crp/Fnr family transcriptional regulator [Microvirga pudoricolor]|uniref:Crp/Fnr family transcriptional regulator n=1 Tax=Microvirga pudoricolor TaxID=2778729 RepID=UPI00195003F5|nr:Crp/Fnr family transcriptional regulator [Microvirga pudoricolor]MBM6594286.1 Crp/Fnr family transcriptional regulator [Microvirga pudoricolor]
MTWMSGFTWILALDWLGAALAILGASMRTIIPLRCVGIAGNFAGLIAAVTMLRWPSLVVNTILLPLNLWRLVQMIKLIKKVKTAAKGDLSMDWLKPFMSRRPVKTGEILFSKGDAANCMYFTLSGQYRLRQLGIEILPGRVVGEMGFLSPDNRRTQTLECVQDGEILSITYDELRQLYFQNPEFGFYFLRLVSERMFYNMERLENEISVLRAGAEERIVTESIPTVNDHSPASSPV